MSAKNDMDNANNNLKNAIQIVSKLSPEQKVELMTKFWDQDYDFEGQLVFYTGVTKK